MDKIICFFCNQEIVRSNMIDHIRNKYKCNRHIFNITYVSKSWRGEFSIDECYIFFEGCSFSHKFNDNKSYYYNKNNIFNRLDINMIIFDYTEEQLLQKFKAYALFY